jgi:putative acetyltransferase
MAVSPPHQCCAVGSRLVEEALVLARERGHAGVVVLGHPEYYPRFGFVPAKSFALRYPAPVPDEAFMAAELAPGGFAGLAGDVGYHAAFDAVE